MPYNPNSISNVLARFKQARPTITETEAVLGEGCIQRYVKLLEQAYADPLVVNAHIERTVMALRGGQDPRKMIQEAKGRRALFEGSPYTTVNGNFATWDAVVQALEGACRD